MGSTIHVKNIIISFETDLELYFDTFKNRIECEEGVEFEVGVDIKGGNILTAGVDRPYDNLIWQVLRERGLDDEIFIIEWVYDIGVNDVEFISCKDSIVTVRCELEVEVDLCKPDEQERY